MPNKKSAEKELRKNIKRNIQNTKVKDIMKKAVKTSLKLVANGKKVAKEDLSKTIKAIDKAAKKGVIKKNTAARKKSRLQKKINTLK